MPRIYIHVNMCMHEFMCWVWEMANMCMHEFIHQWGGGGLTVVGPSGGVGVKLFQVLGLGGGAYVLA